MRFDKDHVSHAFWRHSAESLLPSANTTNRGIVNLSLQAFPYCPHWLRCESIKHCLPECSSFKTVLSDVQDCQGLSQDVPLSLFLSLTLAIASSIDHHGIAWIVRSYPRHIPQCLPDALARVTKYTRPSPHLTLEIESHTQKLCAERGGLGMRLI